MNFLFLGVGMKPLSERDENQITREQQKKGSCNVGMKPLSERDENAIAAPLKKKKNQIS